MHHVFISYSREDSEWVLKFVRQLELSGHVVWLDQRDIPMTLPWFEEVRDAITAADLFVMCDSPSSRDSASCAAEAAVAFEAVKESLMVEVDSSVPESKAAVARAINGLSNTYRMRVELAVLARDWDRAGRSRKSLVTNRQRRRLLIGRRMDPELQPFERSFLRASRSRWQQRLAISTFVTILAFAAGIVALAFDEAEKRIKSINDKQSRAYAERYQIARQKDPYLLLSEAIKQGNDESAVGADVIATALAHPVADDAFRAPAEGLHFATKYIGRSVVVSNSTGSYWSRRAAERSIRVAKRVSRSAVDRRSVAGPNGLRVVAARHASTVRVTKASRLWRQITFSSQPRHVQLSPNGREVAAIVGSDIEIAELSLGKVRTTLRGHEKPLVDVAWSVDGSRIWAVSDALVTSWPVRDGRVLLDAPTKQFEAIVPGSSSNRVWLVSHDGGIEEIDTRSGRQLRRIRIDDELRSAGGLDGSFAAVSGERGLWIVPLAGGGPRLVKIPNCVLGRPVVRDSRMIHLPCLGGSILDVRTDGRIVGSTAVNKVGAFAANVNRKTGTLFVSDRSAYLYAANRDSKLNQVFNPQGGGTITRIGISANGKTLVPVGAGSGHVAGLRRGVLAGDNDRAADSWRFDVVLDWTAGTFTADAVAVSQNGKAFAIGYVDGTITQHPTENLVPVFTVRSTIGRIRDMYVSSNDELIVVTRAGIVQRLRLCDVCLSNKAMAKQAESRLKRSIEIGTAASETTRESGA